MFAVFSDQERTIDERIDRIFDVVTYVMRNSKGGITEKRAMKMEWWRLERLAAALDRELRREESGGKSQDIQDLTVDD